MGVAPRAPAEPHRCGSLCARERALLFADAFSRRYGAYTPRPNPRETGLIAQEARRSVPTEWQTESPPTPQQCATMGKIIAACDGSQVERHAMLVERLATPEGERLCAAMLCFAMCYPQLAPAAEPVETVEDECANSPLEDECDAKKISQVHKLIIKLAQKSGGSGRRDPPPSWRPELGDGVRRERGWRWELRWDDSKRKCHRITAARRR
jgi:hypothetical protein